MPVRQYMPTKKDEIERLFASGTTSFNMINALLEWSAIQLNESLADNRLVSTITTLDVHHATESTHVVEQNVAVDVGKNQVENAADVVDYRVSSSSPHRS